MDNLFSGDIDTVEIPEGGLELALGVFLETWGRPRMRRIQCWGRFFYSDQHEWQSLRTLFLRKQGENE